MGVATERSLLCATKGMLGPYCRAVVALSGGDESERGVVMADGISLYGVNFEGEENFFRPFKSEKVQLFREVVVNEM